MKKPYIYSLLLLGLLSLPAVVSAAVITWDFQTPSAAGVAPPGWQNASQAGSPASYQVEAFSGTTALRITAAANTWNRVKVATSSTYTSGTYTWRVFIPVPSETGAATAIAAFLYSPQSTGDLSAREVDFEIGYGTAAARTQYGIPAGKLMCYMTVQRDDSSNTPHSSVVFQPADPANHITPGNWYTLSIQLGVDTLGRYVHNWFIQRDGDNRLQGRSPFTSQYGPANAFPTVHRIYCSVENLSGLWIGDQQPTTNQVAWFDWVSFDNGVQTQTGTNVLTDIETDSTTAGFPNGSDRQWTRFGAAYNGLVIDSNAVNAAGGVASVLATADFSAGTFFGIRYNVPGAALQLPADGEVRYSARREGAGNPLTRLVLVELDGDIWIDNSPHPLSTTYQQYSVPLTAQRLTLADGSGGADLDLNVQLIGFDVLANGATSGTPSVRYDEVLYTTQVPSSVPDWNLYWVSPGISLG